MADQTWGAFPVRMSDLSSFQITSRSQWACSIRQCPRTWASRSSGVTWSGARLAYAFRHVDGVPHLKVELPDGMPGLVPADATDVFGSGQAAGTGLILSGAGLRRLHAVVMRLRERDVPGGRL